MPCMQMILGALFTVAGLSASPPVAGYAELTGQVLSGQTGKPITGAKVEMSLRSEETHKQDLHLLEVGVEWAYGY